MAAARLSNAISSAHLISRASSITCWPSFTFKPAFSSSNSIGGSMMSTPIGMRRVMAQGDFRPMAQNREAMADLVAILDARSTDYARAEAELDTSGDTAADSFAGLVRIVSPMLGSGRRQP